MNTSSNPLVTVILPFYNEKKSFLNQSINSILNQTYKNFELLLVNDGSNIKYEIPEDNRIRLLNNSSNLGLGRSINNALKISRGKYIVRQDSDDISFVYRIEQQVNLMENNTSIDLCGSSCIIINENNSILGLRFCGAFHFNIIKQSWKEIRIQHPTWIVKKSWALSHLYKNLKRGQDQFLLITNKNNSNFYCISKPLVFYRIKYISLSKRFYGRFSIIYANIVNRDLINTSFSIIYQFLATLRDMYMIGFKSMTIKNIWNINLSIQEIKKYAKIIKSTY
jgi:glycosyltransferase involved in cell wall biosynthesis